MTSVSPAVRPKRRASAATSGTANEPAGDAHVVVNLFHQFVQAVKPLFPAQTGHKFDVTVCP